MTRLTPYDYSKPGPTLNPKALRHADKLRNENMSDEQKKQIAKRPRRKDRQRKVRKDRA